MTTSPEMTGWAAAMGISIVRCDAEEVVAEVMIDGSHRQAFGFVHGGVYCGLVETACSMGAWLVAHGRGQSVMGLENSTSFITAARSGTLRARATPVIRGRKTQVWETTVSNQGRVVAIGRVRFLCTKASAEPSPLS